MVRPNEASSMSKDTKKTVVSQTTVIAGKKVKFASPQDAKKSSNKVKDQYAQALENLKNR